MSATETPRLLTVAEAAERLRVSRLTVYRRLADGLIPALRLGDESGPLRVDEGELDAWLYGMPSAGVSAPLGARKIPAHERGVPDEGESTASALAGLEEDRG